MTGTSWIVMRTAPEPEPVAHLDDRDEAMRLADELGPPHVALPVPHVVAGQWRVVHTWACRARVVAGRAEVGEPYRLAGASRVVRPDDVAGEVERVEVDQAAAELEEAVHGRPVEVHLTGYAEEPARAVELARRRAEELASGAD